MTLTDDGSLPGSGMSASGVAHVLPAVHLCSREATPPKNGIQRPTLRAAADADEQPGT